MIVLGKDCSNHKSYHLARLSVLVKINLKLFPLAFTPKCKVRYLHCNLTKKQSHAHIFFVFPSFLLFQMHLAHQNHLENIVTRCMVTVFALVIALVF